MQVVVADDDAMMRRLISSAVADLGHTVIVCDDGDTAWRAIDAHRPPLAILDWHMPLVDGIEVCRRTRASEYTRHTFVLVVTGRGEPEALQHALESGADDYLVKPIDPAGLHARLVIAERRIALDAERRDAVARLVRAQWLAGIGETALAVQHELNNPLAALVFEADALVRQSGAGGELGALAESILAQAQRIATTVRRLAQLQDPRSVEYLEGGPRMIDLSEP